MSNETKQMIDADNCVPCPFCGDTTRIMEYFTPTTPIPVRTWLAGMADVPWNAVIETLEKKCPDLKGMLTVDEVLEYRAELKCIEADAILAQLRKDTQAGRVDE